MQPPFNLKFPLCRDIKEWVQAAYKIRAQRLMEFLLKADHFVLRQSFHTSFQYTYPQ